MQQFKTSVLLVLGIVLTASALQAGQAPAPAPSVQQLLESGKWQDAVTAAEQQLQSGAGSDMVWLRSMGLEKLGQREQARQLMTGLVNDDANNPWRYVGESAAARLGGNNDLAVSAARRATELAPDLFQAQYELGLAESLRGQFAEAAAAFERATAINNGFAYAHYNAGLAYSKTKQVDKMAQHFDTFLKLAPNAPERPAVQTIMRTVRGR